MNIKYKILWVDDESDFIESATEDFKDFLENQGYELDVSRYFERPGGVAEYLESDKWDLILMDYKLSEKLVGTTLITKVRDNDIFTEIVFYSSDPDTLTKQIQKESLEGVYWADRNGNFEEKVKNIIGLTLRKALDINNVRGLVMAEVADIDHELDDIIRMHHDSLHEDSQKKVRERILNRAREHAEENLAAICCISNTCSIEDCFKLTIMDSNKRFREIKKISKQNKEKISPDCRDKISIYDTMLTKRNLLAHGKTTTVDGTEVVVSTIGEFKVEDVVEVRKDLIKYRNSFSELKDALAKN